MEQIYVSTYPSIVSDASEQPGVHKPKADITKSTYFVHSMA